MTTQSYSVIREVDNRVFLLGLDALCRATMKSRESGELLKSAEEVCGDLGVEPLDVPVEGYYYESEALTRYFRLIRALQATNISRASEIRHVESWRRLQAVTTSPIFGSPRTGNFVLNTTDNVLSAALLATAEFWSVDAVIKEAYRLAIASDEISLVALAALAEDAVCITALRETVVLQGGLTPRRKMVPEQPTYEWSVDPEIEDRAARFVAVFNPLFDASIPLPGANNARRFWGACNWKTVIGRCVAIGEEPRHKPKAFYHWAIRPSQTGHAEVAEFWDDMIWTTQKYRQHLFGPRRFQH